MINGKTFEDEYCLSDNDEDKDFEDLLFLKCKKNIDQAQGDPYYSFDQSA